jgi:hypothetical protein
MLFDLFNQEYFKQKEVKEHKKLDRSQENI